MKYKIIFDNGKPYEILVDSDKALKDELKRFYENKDNDFYFDVKVFNDKDEDITESQFITEIFLENEGSDSND